MHNRQQHDVAWNNRRIGRGYQVDRDRRSRLWLLLGLPENDALAIAPTPSSLSYPTSIVPQTCESQTTHNRSQTPKSDRLLAKV